MSSSNTLTKFENIEHLSQYLNNIVNNLSNETGESQDQDLKIFEKIIRNYFRQRAIDESHPLPAELPEHIQKSLENAFKIHHSTIVNTLIKEKLLSNGHKLMENYDWKLRWILGSSKLASVREPICQLELYCTGKDSINFECTLEQIEELVNVLSNVKKEIDQFK